MLRSVTSDFDWVCENQWVASLSQAAFFIGKLIFYILLLWVAKKLYFYPPRVFGGPTLTSTLVILFSLVMISACLKIKLCMFLLTGVYCTLFDVLIYDEVLTYVCEVCVRFDIILVSTMQWKFCKSKHNKENNVHM